MVMRAPKAGSRGNFHFRRPWLLPCSLPDQTIRPRPRTEEIDNPATNQAQKNAFFVASHGFSRGTRAPTDRWERGRENPGELRSLVALGCPPRHCLAIPGIKKR
jgi:hypothetical protein